MGIILNQPAYTQLIEEDIEVLEKFIPAEYSLEKGHIRAVLLESIEMRYPPYKKKRRRRWFFGVKQNITLFN